MIQFTPMMYYTLGIVVINITMALLIIHQISRIEDMVDEILDKTEKESK